MLIDSPEITGDAKIPVGLIAYISNATVPSGWTEYEAARGRMIVGLRTDLGVGNYTNEGTVGTALTDQQDKTHNHSYAHTHELNHTHTINAHTHQWYVYVSGANDRSFDSAGNWATLGSASDSDNGIYADGTSKLSLGQNMYTSDTALTTNDANDATTDSQSTSTSGTASTSDVLAYIQLMAIVKT